MRKRARERERESVCGERVKEREEHIRQLKILNVLQRFFGLVVAGDKLRSYQKLPHSVVQ